MAIPVKRKVKVIHAKYVEEADSILITGECQEGRLMDQIHSNSFSFNGKDKITEMKKMAEMMIGKTIMMVFDPDLIGKIKDHVSLRY